MTWCHSCGAQYIGPTHNCGRGSVSADRLRELRGAEAELERLRPIVQHVAGLTHVDRGNDYASVHRTLVHQAREALEPTTTEGDA